MKKYHRKTLIPRPNVDVHSLWNNIDPTSLEDTSPRWKRYHPVTDIWDAETYKKLNEIGFLVKSIRVFRWRPGMMCEWHIDGTAAVVEHFAINWVVEGQGCIQWDSSMELTTYEPKSGADRLNRGIKLGSIEDYVEEETNGDQCIVDISIPHRVINLSSEHRITISVLFNTNLTYSDAVSVLDTNNLLVD
jgi:hypothetical protein